MMTDEELDKLLQDRAKNTFMNELTDALWEYAQHFNSTFPGYGFPGTEEEMIICARDCVEQDKDVYELGYMVHPKDLNGIIY